MKFWRFMSSLDLGSWKLGTDWLCMAAANHMPQLKQYCSWMFKREDWEVTHLHKLIEKEYENHTIQMPVTSVRDLRLFCCRFTGDSNLKQNCLGSLYLAGFTCCCPIMNASRLLIAYFTLHISLNDQCKSRFTLWHWNLQCALEHVMITYIRQGRIVYNTIECQIMEVFRN